MRRIGLALPFLLACWIAPAAAAQSPAGVWSFTTEPTAYGCTISGQMTIKPRDGMPFACTFTAVQACTQRLPKAIHTEQSCTAVQAGEQVSITSRLERITAVDPVSMTEQVGYAPDDFTLTLNASGSEMIGKYSSNRTAPAKFRRRQELTS